MRKVMNRLLIIPLIFLVGCTATTGGPWNKHADIKSWSIQKQNTAYRFEVRPGDGWEDGFKKSSRAEFFEKWNAPLNHETWYGLSIFIPKDIHFDTSGVIFIAGVYYLIFEKVKVFLRDLCF